MSNVHILYIYTKNSISLAFLAGLSVYIITMVSTNGYFLRLIDCLQIAFNFQE
jgi:hypothetical protein